VPVTARDEFGELGVAFNDMSASLQTKQQLIDEQRRENEELLSSLMPETEARRYRDGEENISTEYRDVSVVYAQLLGFDDFARSLPAGESVTTLNALVGAFDGAAERHGVEQVRSMQDNGLLATCGLVVPRVDHASRTIAFAIEVTEILDSFNDQNGAALTVRVGIDSGPVTSGLVGQRSTIYALWGEAVDLVKDQRAAVAMLEGADLAVESAGEAARLVPEQHRIDRSGRNAGEVDDPERLLGARGCAVHRAHQHFLAGAAFAFDQHMAVAARGLGGLRQRRAKLRGGADHRIEIERG
jgi:class 3 adenylate cyclase